MSTTYDLSDVIPEDRLSALRPGSSVLLSGPSLVGKRRLAIRMLGAGHRRGDGILLVTTKDSVETTLDEFERHVPDLDPGRIGLIDCSGSEGRAGIRDVATERVGSPGDLTGISIGAAKLMQRFTDQQISSIRHGLISISTLLQYLNEETVFKFLHIYTSRVEASDGLAIFTMDDDTHEPRTVNTMTGEFDGVVVLRETDSGAVEYRLRGFDSSPTQWSVLE